MVATCCDNKQDKLQMALSHWLYLKTALSLEVAAIMSHDILQSFKNYFLEVPPSYFLFTPQKLATIGVKRTILGR